MGWVEHEDLHRCDLPSPTEGGDRKELGQLWQCDEDACGLVWRIIAWSSGRDGRGARYKYELVQVPMIGNKRWSRPAAPKTS